MSTKLSKVHQRVLDKNRIAHDEELKAKQEADKAALVNNFWDVAHEHYNSSMEAIAHVEGTLRDVLVEFVKDGSKVKKVKDHVALADNINILSKDLNEHVDRLNNIYSKHSDKTGGTSTADEHMSLLQIHGEYAEALEVYEANIIPTVSFILEQIGTVEELLVAEQQATDVNVITDVEVKTPTEQLTESAQ